MNTVKRVEHGLSVDEAWDKIHEIQRASHVADAHIGKLLIGLFDGNAIDVVGHELEPDKDRYDWVGGLIGKSAGHVRRLEHFARMLPWIEGPAREYAWLVGKGKQKPPALLLKESHCRILLKCLPRAGVAVDDETGEQLAEAFHALAVGAEKFAAAEKWAKPSLSYKEAEFNVKRFYSPMAKKTRRKPNFTPPNTDEPAPIDVRECRKQADRWLGELAEAIDGMREYLNPFLDRLDADIAAINTRTKQAPQGDQMSF